ncbi:hypothetical protein [uncultured Bacteroides sp.]|uniref:hypothetical protein n=1 Tax=uncultured Bacteroides sp. TaxID=162156 RepID=UPI002AA8BA11|nr:hypothetical protein [uncultured Bacteroides sp.]
MEIIPIFAKNLFAFQYPNETMDEFERLFDCWRDIEYLENFFEENKDDLTSDFWNTSIEKAIKSTLSEAKLFERKLLDIAKNSETESIPDLEELFKPLNNASSGLVELSMSKAYGVKYPSWLRIYAIKIETNVYIVTGGAIKLTETMNERTHLKEELRKLDFCKRWLRSEGILDREGLCDND